MELFGCILAVLMVAGPLVGLISLAAVVQSAMRGRIDRPRCPMCGYDEVGRTASSLCPECGLNRYAAELAAWKTLRWPIIAPVAAAAVLSIGLIALATHLSPGLLVWILVWHAVPFVVLTIAGAMYGVRRWRTISWLVVGVPVLILAAATAWESWHLAFPSPMPRGTYPYERALMQNIGSVIFGVVCSGLIGWWLAGIALVLSVRGPLAKVPVPISQDANGNRCGRCGYDLAGLPDGAVCPECGAARATG